MKLSIDGRFLTQDVTGVQRVAIEFVRALDELIAEGAFPGLDVTLWVPRAGTVVTVLPLKSVKICRAGRLTGHAWEQLELPRLAGRSILLCLGNTAPVLRLATGRAPTYTFVHDLSYKYFPSAYSWQFRLFYNTVMPIVLARSAHVFTVSVSEEQSILRQYPRLIGPRRITAVQNGGGEPAIEVQVSSTRGAFLPGAAKVAPDMKRPQMCLYVGSLTKRKNGEGLVRAAEKLVEALNVKFVFVGATGASFEDVGVEVEDRHRDRIVFLGQVNEAERVEELYRQAKVLVFPSFYEASPLPPIEAMSFGSPVVCSDIPSLRERCGDAALYCDPADVKSIVDQVTRVLTDDDLWRSLQQRGFAQAASFLWKRQVKAVLRVLESA